jgi:hypothetical protein
MCFLVLDFRSLVLSPWRPTIFGWIYLMEKTLSTDLGRLALSYLYLPAVIQMQESVTCFLSRGQVFERVSTTVHVFGLIL